jgi:DNA transposition AAA+ family ATPase
MYAKEQKKQLRSELLEEIKASGLSNNKFAVERLSFSNGSKLSHVVNNWDKDGFVGDETWQVIEHYLNQKRSYKIVATKNLIKVWDVCERAYHFKSTMVISGEGGYGKTMALKKFKEDAESKGKFKVYYFDASMVRTRKQFIVELMTLLSCYKAGTMSRQIPLIRDAVQKQKCLIIIDEVSSLAGLTVTVLKDVMTAIKDTCGMVLAGTPYFMNNINKGASKDKHLFSETKDRLFLLPEALEAPTEKEAKAIFEANGIHGEALDIVMGNDPKLIKKSFKAKPTYRGVADCITMIKIATGDHKSNVKHLSIL